MTLVTAAVIRRDNTLLLTRRAPGENLAGSWEFPGGKVREGEALSDCLQRELAEELGLKTKVGVEILRSVGTNGQGDITLIALETQILSGEIALSVHDAAEWVPLEKLLEYKLAPLDIPIAKALMRDSA